MDEVSCPRCKTTKYRNPSLKLMVNVCGHALCENCVELLFVRGSGSCPQCGTALRRSNFRLQLFEDSFVEKEVDIRKRILKDFNKKEHDFQTLREYNDYLEEVETLVFNLTNGIDVEETKRRVDQYKKENQELIKKNRSKLSKDEELIEELIESEKQELEIFREQARQEDLDEQKSKVKSREALIDDLMFSDLPADHIVNQHRREQEVKQQQSKVRQTTFSSGIRIGGSLTSAAVPHKEEAVLFVYTAPEHDLCGPTGPTDQQLQKLGYLDHIRSASGSELGGGFISDIPCKRALQDAFCGLYFSMQEDAWSRQDNSGSMDIG